MDEFIYPNQQRNRDDATQQDRRGKRPDPSYEERTDAIRGFIDEGIAVLR